jgi:hypothetical protein
MLGVVVSKCISRMVAACVTESFSNDKIRRLIEEIKAIPKLLEAVASKNKVEKMLEKRGLFIKPTEIVLETREKRKAVASSAQTVNVLVEETMQYIRLGPLQQKLSKQTFDTSQLHAPSDEREVGLIACLLQLKTFVYNTVCQRHPDAFLIHLFIDAFETSNELGRHSGVHKLEGLYMQVQNMPGRVQSQLDNIFLVCL